MKKVLENDTILDESKSVAPSKANVFLTWHDLEFIVPNEN